MFCSFIKSSACCVSKVVISWSDRIATIGELNYVPCVPVIHVKNRCCMNKFDHQISCSSCASSIDLHWKNIRITKQCRRNNFKSNVHDSIFLMMFIDLVQLDTTAQNQNLSNFNKSLHTLFIVFKSNIKFATNKFTKPHFIFTIIKIQNHSSFHRFNSSQRSRTLSK